MNVVETLRADFEEEMPSTRKVIERVPGDRGEWRPHPKSFPVGHLAQLVSWIPGWITNIATEPRLDLMTAPRYSFETTDTLLQGFDRNVRRRGPRCSPSMIRSSTIHGRSWRATRQ